MKISLSYSRTIQLRQYEPVILSGTIDEVEVTDQDIEAQVKEYAARLEGVVDEMLLSKIERCNTNKDNIEELQF